MEPDDLITYCGGYGGSCAGFVGYPHQKHLARIFAEWLDASGCEHWMPESVKEFDYHEFRKGLDYFSSEESPPRCHKCCKGGDGNPECAVRICCREKRLSICADCSDFPCDKLRPEWLAQLKEYREVGRTEWLRKRVRMAEHGYELHTGKYYRFYAEQTPPGDDVANKTAGGDA